MYSAWVEFAFKIINFGIVLGFSIYYFRKKILLSIQDQIQESEDFRKNLFVEKDQLGEQQDHLAQEVVDQRTYAKLLEQKIMAWQKAVKQEGQDLFFESEKNKTYCWRRVRIRQKNRMFADAKLAVLPQAFKSASKVLKEKFSSSKKAGEDYLDTAIRTMGNDIL